MNKRNQLGFLLFEIGIFLIILSVAGLGLAWWYCKMLEQRNCLYKNFQALMFATNLIEYFKVYGQIPKNAMNQSQYEVKWDIIADKKLKEFKYIQLKVSYKNGNKQNLINLNSGVLMG